MHGCLHLQGEMHLQNDGSRHPSVSDEEENFAVLRRSVRGILQIDLKGKYAIIVSFSIWLIIYWMSVHYRHVMNELLETERAYVEELLCVLEVSYTDTFDYFFCDTCLSKTASRTRKKCLFKDYESTWI